MESRRRVKEQQKRMVPAEYSNTHFSYTIGPDGVEKFVVTTELQSENEIGTDLLASHKTGRRWLVIEPLMNRLNVGLTCYRVEFYLDTR